MKSWQQGKWEIRLWACGNLAWGWTGGGNLWQLDLGFLQIRRFFKQAVLTHTINPYNPADDIDSRKPTLEVGESARESI